MNITRTTQSTSVRRAVAAVLLTIALLCNSLRPTQDPALLPDPVPIAATRNAHTSSVRWP
jgi:hypothetical protein